VAWWKEEGSQGWRPHHQGALACPHSFRPGNCPNRKSSGSRHSIRKLLSCVTPSGNSANLTPECISRTSVTMTKVIFGFPRSRPWQTLSSVYSFRECNWGATWKKSSGSGLQIREYGRRDPARSTRGALYPRKLALNSPTNGGRSVGIIRSRIEATEFTVSGVRFLVKFDTNCG
jgi:hypothetical protein